MYHYIIPSDNWEQQLKNSMMWVTCYYIIPSDNWEQQRLWALVLSSKYYIIPSDNWEQQLNLHQQALKVIISYQAITGNNNYILLHLQVKMIISYQAITGNNN